MPQLETQPSWLRVAKVGSPKAKVDFDKGIISDIRLAELGKFNDFRGRFDESSMDAFLEISQRLGRKGLKARWTHGNASEDSVGKHLGRITKFSIGDDGAFLGSLKFAKAAYDTPQHGNLAKYVMELADEDPDAFGMSFVAKFDFLNEDGKVMTPEAARTTAQKKPNSVLWIPTLLHSADVVGSPAATSRMLSDQSLSFDNAAALATEALDRFFDDQPREVVKGRASAFLDKYLLNRYGDSDVPTDTPPADPVDKKDPPADPPKNKLETDPPTNPPKTPEPSPPADPPANLEQEDPTLVIAELCQLAKCPERTVEFVKLHKGGETLSSIRGKLVELGSKDHGPSDGLPPKDETDPPKKTIEQLAKEEFDANKKMYRQMNLSRKDHLAAYKLENDPDDLDDEDFDDDGNEDSDD